MSGSIGRSRITVYSLAALFVFVAGALGNAIWREGLLQPYVPTDTAFIVASGLIAAVAMTVWRPRDALVIWVVFLPVALALGAIAALFTATGLYGDSL